MKKITSHLWFDKEAKEAVEFYVAAFGAFGDAKITSSRTIHDTPSGDCDILSFELLGHPFMAISAGPYFKLNPAISFFVNFDPSKDTDAKAHLDELWAELSEGGKVLMPLDTYPFSQHYGWIEDKFGVSWQLILTNPEGEDRPAIIPSFLFVGDVMGKAEEAIHFYVSIFRDTKIGQIARYPEGADPQPEGSLMFGDFNLEGNWFAAMDSFQKNDFAFNEAVSFMVPCDTQAEIDYYSDKLSAVPEAEQCGWLKDRYGVSWQITPTAMDKMMAEGTPEQIDRVTKAFLSMKRFDIAKLEDVFRG